MYAVNPTKRALLISPAEVLDNTSSEGVSHSKVLHAIPIAEDRFVRQALGDEYYEALVLAKNKVMAPSDLATYQPLIDAALEGTQPYAVKAGDIINASELLAAADLLLWDQRLCKYVAECVMAVAMPENYAQFTEQGVMKSNPIAAVVGDAETKSVGVSLKDMQWLMDKAMERLSPLAESLHNFICKNTTNYPLYKNCVTCGGTTVATAQRKSNWVDLDIYND